jgi:hypothetical protein
MSKKQPENNFGETFASLLILATQHPKEAKAAYNIINALGAVTYDLTTATLDYLFPRKTETTLPEPQQQTAQPSPPSIFGRSSPSPFEWPSNQNSKVVWVNGNFIRIP